MKFFEQQELARKNTVFLTVAFIFNVLILSAVNAFLVGHFLSPTDNAIYTAFLLSIFVFLSMIYITSMNAKNGRNLAEWLGGSPLSWPPSQPAEKRFYNVVEEMSLASGVPVPALYILKDDDSINAFAAGSDPQSLVIAVTQGALDSLTRDELQAVIGHEFSHILNEDMKLNIRLGGVVAGFLIFMQAGLRLSRGADARIGTRRSKGGGQIFIFALLLAAFGSLGYFLARWIQSSISKNREFLADASSAQFTRNPSALAQALAKIGYASGSLISSPNKLQMAHIFFAEAMDGFWTSIFSTHPPVEDRIKKLVPGVELNTFYGEVEKKWEKYKNSQASAWEEAYAESKKSPVKPLTNFETAALISSVASPSLVHFQYAESTLKEIPAEIRNSIVTKANAELALLSQILKTQSTQIQGAFVDSALELDDERGKQLKIYLDYLEKNKGKEFFFFRMALGVQQQQPLEVRNNFLEQIRKLFEYDQAWTFKEVLYFLICQNSLSSNAKESHRPEANLQKLLPSLFRFLAASTQVNNNLKLITWEGVGRDVYGKVRIFQTLPEKSYSFETLDKEIIISDIFLLANASLLVKKKIITVMFDFFFANQKIDENELELLQIMSLTLKVPLPPLVEKNL